MSLPQPAGMLLERLVSELDWQSRTIMLFGKPVMQPRLVAWYADHGLSYRYSGTDHVGAPLSALLEGIRECVERSTQERFNSVLCNYYRDGSDSMGMHADDEPELGAQPVIASLSLGQVRTLRFKHRFEREQPDVRLPLENGSLLVMAGDTQRYWKHGIAKTRKPCGPRVNLTFRQILPGAR